MAITFTPDQLRKAGYIEINGQWVKSNTIQAKEKPLVKLPKPKKNYSNKEKEFIQATLDNFRLDYTTEQYFWPRRRFRFDFAVPMFKLAIEYEGIMFVPNDEDGNPGKSRHTTITGFSNDCSKYNEAALQRWVVLRYTAKTYKDFPQDLARFISELPTLQK